jgi:hypothetical protein
LSIALFSAGVTRVVPVFGGGAGSFSTCFAPGSGFPPYTPFPFGLIYL